MSLIDILKDDFISFFGAQKVIDEHAHIVQYSIITSGLEHIVYIDPNDNLICLTVTSPSGTAINMILHNITNIRCERTEPTVKFYFYQGARPEPIAEMMVQPTIFIVVDVQS